MHEAGLLSPALEGNVVAHIHGSATERIAAQALRERVDDMSPSGPVHRDGADIDLWRIGFRGRLGLGTPTAVAVAVDIEQHEPPIFSGDSGQRLAQHGIIGRMHIQRAADQWIGGALGPHIEPPGMVRSQIDRAFDIAVEIDLKA